MKNPKPFCLNKKNFKAFVLGADPTNFSDNGNPKQLEYAFGILSDEPRYFSGILKNLNQIGLHLEDVYVQNMVQEYLKDETSKNKEWEKYAEQWITSLISELNQIDPNKTKPILVTAERIMKFLVNDNYKLPAAKEIYSDKSKALYYITPNNNKLKRSLIAFYRHPTYNLLKKINYSSLLNKEFKYSTTGA